jgi:hypothetical protein
MADSTMMSSMCGLLQVLISEGVFQGAGGFATQASSKVVKGWEGKGASISKKEDEEGTLMLRFPDILPYSYP